VRDGLAKSRMYWRLKSTSIEAFSAFQSLIVSSGLMRKKEECSVYMRLNVNLLYRWFVQSQKDMSSQVKQSVSVMQW